MFSPLATTKMACIGNNIEPEFIAALGKINSWRIINDQLLFANDKKSIMKLKAVQVENNALDGQWELNYITGPRIAFDGLYPNKKPTIKFNLPANELGGNTSCNGFSSKIIMNGNNLSIAEPFAKTMIFCEGGGENTFLAMLKKVNSYKIIDGNILSFMMDDLLLMRFKKL